MLNPQCVRGKKKNHARVPKNSGMSVGDICNLSYAAFVPAITFIPPQAGCYYINIQDGPRGKGGMRMRPIKGRIRCAQA